MDRIDGASGYIFRPDLPQEKSEGQKRKEKSVRTGKFSSLFNTSKADGEPKLLDSAELQELLADTSQLREVLAGFADEVHRYGDALAKRPSRENLASYRNAVAKFLKLAAAGSFGIEEHLSKKDILNQKKYILIRTIDEKLEQLAVGILRSQQSGLQILAKLEEINGLIVDLLQ